MDAAATQRVARVVGALADLRARLQAEGIGDIEIVAALAGMMHDHGVDVAAMVDVAAPGDRDRDAPIINDAVYESPAFKRMGARLKKALLRVRQPAVRRVPTRRRRARARRRPARRSAAPDGSSSSTQIPVTQ